MPPLVGLVSFQSMISKLIWSHCQSNALVIFMISPPSFLSTQTGWSCKESTTLSDKYLKICFNIDIGTRTWARPEVSFSSCSRQILLNFCQSLTIQLLWKVHFSWVFHLCQITWGGKATLSSSTCIASLFSLSPYWILRTIIIIASISIPRWSVSNHVHCAVEPTLITYHSWPLCYISLILQSHLLVTFLLSSEMCDGFLPRHAEITRCLTHWSSSNSSLSFMLALYEPSNTVHLFSISSILPMFSLPWCLLRSAAVVSCFVFSPSILDPLIYQVSVSCLKQNLHFYHLVRCLLYARQHPKFFIFIVLLEPYRDPGKEILIWHF